MPGIVSRQFATLSFPASGGGSTTATATITAVTVANCRVRRVGSDGTVFGVTPAEYHVELSLTGTTTVQGVRGADGSAIDVQVVIEEWDIAVESGSFAMTGAEGSDTVTLTTSVTKANACLWSSHQTSSTGSFDSAMVRHRISTDGNDALFDRETASGTVDGTYYMLADAAITMRHAEFSASGWWGHQEDIGDTWDHDAYAVDMSYTTPYADEAPMFYMGTTEPSTTRREMSADTDYVSLYGIIAGASGSMNVCVQLMTISGMTVETWDRIGQDADDTIPISGTFDYSRTVVQRTSGIHWQGDSGDFIDFVLDTVNDEVDAIGMSNADGYSVQIIEYPAGSTGSTGDQDAPATGTGVAAGNADQAVPGDASSVSGVAIDGVPNQVVPADIATGTGVAADGNVTQSPASDAPTATGAAADATADQVVPANVASATATAATSAVDQVVATTPATAEGAAAGDAVGGSEGIQDQPATATGLVVGTVSQTIYPDSAFATAIAAANADQSVPANTATATGEAPNAVVHQVVPGDPAAATGSAHGDGIGEGQGAQDQPATATGGAAGVADQSVPATTAAATGEAADAAPDQVVPGLAAAATGEAEGTAVTGDSGTQDAPATGAGVAASSAPHQVVPGLPAVATGEAEGDATSSSDGDQDAPATGVGVAADAQPHQVVLTLVSSGTGVVPGSAPHQTVPGLPAQASGTAVGAAGGTGSQDAPAEATGAVGPVGVNQRPLAAASTAATGHSSSAIVHQNVIQVDFCTGVGVAADARPGSTGTTTIVQRRDFSRLIRRFANVKDLQCARHGGHTVVDGVYRSQGWTQFTIPYAAIFPIQGRETKYFPEGFRDIESLRIATEVSLQAMSVEDGDDLVGDVFEYQGELFQVHNFGDWRTDGFRWMVAVRLDRPGPTTIVDFIIAEAA